MKLIDLKAKKDSTSFSTSAFYNTRLRLAQYNGNLLYLLYEREIKFLATCLALVQSTLHNQTS